ncbi:hypothetical protein K504DRAFT_468813 [Pleomassaria siparia CBS 279.74]|uniref:BHLH domain-containing protein n=1 Tax=Pleomassaria siparia CBS 279.74 TaxID=1314801 RepID=A0A6G1K7Q7_9PLEO|nr:hypothetical protein K504DRAFT_468813 [Pleomassaria siparia CBS 279.74]
MNADLSAYPMVANTDYSPTNQSFPYPDTFSKPYLTDLYATSPDHSLDTFLDCDSFFDRPVFSSIEYPAAFNGANTSPNTSTAANMNAYRCAFNPAPFGQLEQGFGPSFPFDMPSSFESNLPMASCNTKMSTPDVNNININNSSPTPSLCGDGPPSGFPTSPPLSPSALKRESPDDPTSADEEPSPKRPQRKRGRPRLDRNISDTPSSCSHPSSFSKQQHQQRRMSRLPHNQVERKYREGLNSELERLRRTVPTLPQSDEGASMGQPKPSKAMVLAGAIEYIRSIERERDELREENERLGGKGWRQKQTKRRQDSATDLVVEE